MILLTTTGLLNFQIYAKPDLAFIPIGSYAPREVEMEHHVNPEEAVQIYNDLNIQYAYGIHWGTFFLSKEDLYEPPALIKDLISEDVIFSTRNQAFHST